MSLSLVTAMKESELKEILTDLINEKRNWSEVDQLLIIKSMMEHIGTTDAKLRDQLIYTSFFRLIIERNEIDAGLLKELLEISLADQLFRGIGDTGTDTVFTRAFTSLLVALILYRDNQDHFLSVDKIEQTKERLKEYVNKERDYRGYVPNKGWAHSIAHVADAFDELVKSPKLNKVEYPVLCKALWNKMLVSESVYLHDEDERVITPMMEMLHNGMDVREIENLLQEVQLILNEQKTKLEDEKYWFLVHNLKGFLKSFHLKLHSDTKFGSLQKSIEKCLQGT